MDFELPPEQLRLKQEVREFANAAIKPSAEERSANQRWDDKLWRAIGAQKYPGVVIPAEFGGLGGGLATLCRTLYPVVRCRTLHVREQFPGG